MNSREQCDRMSSMGRVGRKYKTTEAEMNEICRKTNAFLEIIHCTEPIFRIIHCAEPSLPLRFLKTFGAKEDKGSPTVEVTIILSCGVMSS